jgi:GNAT superfamily N-acetyltransferase
MARETPHRTPSAAGISVRPAVHGDLPAIVKMRDALNALELTGSPHAPIQRLSVDEFTTLWGSTLDDGLYCWRIIESEGKPIGFGLIYILPKSRPPAAFLHWAYLDPAHRRRGLGQLLLDHLIGWARGQGAGHIELQFIEGNEAARRFWAKTGFRPYAHKCVYYIDPV